MAVCSHSVTWPRNLTPPSILAPSHCRTAPSAHWVTILSFPAPGALHDGALHPAHAHVHALCVVPRCRFAPFSRSRSRCENERVDSGDPRNPDYKQPALNHIIYEFKIRACARLSDHERNKNRQQNKKHPKSPFHLTHCVEEPSVARVRPVKRLPLLLRHATCVAKSVHARKCKTFM